MSRSKLLALGAAQFLIFLIILLQNSDHMVKDLYELLPGYFFIQLFLHGGSEVEEPKIKEVE